MQRLKLILLILVLVSCSPSGNVTQIVSPIPSSMPVPPTETSTITPMTTNKPEFGGLTERCAEILPTFPDKTLLPWTLVVHSFGEGLSLVNFSNHTQRTIPGLIDGVGTSPDGKWLSYISLSSNSEDLILESSDEQKQVTFDLNWSVYGPIPWLDNERVMFLTRNDYRELQTLVLNPFTGEQEVLSPDYPDFAPFYGPGSTPLYFDYTNVVYDPSLKYVIYPQDSEDGFYLALWDREARQTLVKLLSGVYVPPPLWLSDGQAFVVAARSDKDGPLREWFMVSVDGEIYQLTHFEDMIPQYEFGYFASLSPNGQYLAFGLHVGDLSYFGPMELVILDLQTLETVETCISFDNVAPFWTPDSQYLVVQHPDSDKQFPSIVVLNVEAGWAANIFSDDNNYKTPRGWFYSQK